MDRVRPSSVALVVTSPPYFTGKEYETDMAAGHVPSSYVEYLEMIHDVLAVSLAKLEPGAAQQTERVAADDYGKD